MMTHWIPPFTRESLDGTKQAVCGAFIAEGDHSTEPTCQDCANYLVDEHRHNQITEPGIYALSADAYHADPCPEPSLSSSIAKLLCLSSPAHARHEHPRLNPAAVQEEAERFDIGTAAHAVLLEGEAAVAIVDAADWRTNVAKAARDAARAAGQIPLLAKVWGDVQAMVKAARLQLDRHREGGRQMFRNGDAERTLIWKEDDDIWCRARLDWLRPVTDELFPWAIDDYKTTGASANPDDWTRTMFSAGTDIQVAWYRRAVKALTGADAEFRFAVQENYPPYALSVISLGPAALMLAEKKVLYALDAWRAAREQDDWVGYPRRTCYADLPQWHEAWWLEKELR